MTYCSFFAGRQALLCGDYATAWWLYVFFTSAAARGGGAFRASTMRREAFSPSTRRCGTWVGFDDGAGHRRLGDPVETRAPGAPRIREAHAKRG